MPNAERFDELVEEFRSGKRTTRAIFVPVLSTSSAKGDMGFITSFKELEVFFFLFFTFFFFFYP